jgi:hypothetical protein
MIVRILGEGRFNVPEGDMPAVEQLDAQLTDALDRADDVAFDSALNDLVNQVRHTGTLLPADDLQTSGLVVPHPGSSLSEVKELLAQES